LVTEEHQLDIVIFMVPGNYLYELSFSKYNVDDKWLTQRMISSTPTINCVSKFYRKKLIDLKDTKSKQSDPAVF
jgi:hypothetical protein